MSFPLYMMPPLDVVGVDGERTGADGRPRAGVDAPLTGGVLRAGLEELSGWVEDRWIPEGRGRGATGE